MYLTFKIAMEYLWNRKRQAIISILGVVLGVAFFIAISGMMRGVHNYFIEQLIDVAPHVRVMDEYRHPDLQPVHQLYPGSLVLLHGLKPKDEIKGIRPRERIIRSLKEIEGSLISPILMGEAFLRYGGKDVAAAVIGINPTMERKASNLESDMVQGSLNNLLTNSNGIILGKDLVKKLGADMGAKLSVVSSAGVVRKMKIVGIFDTDVPEFDGSTSYTVLKKAQVLHNKDNTINQINIRLEDINKAPKIAADIESRFGYKTESWQETYASLFDMFIIEDAIMYSTVAAILLVAGFGIFNIISTSVNEKSKDIAILKSMGFSEYDIRMIFLFQGMLVGIVGSIMGCGFGAVLVDLMANIKFEMGDEIQLPVEFDGFPMYRSIWLYVWGSIMAIIASMLSAYFPAKHAASLRPVDIIRGAG